MGILWYILVYMYIFRDILILSFVLNKGYVFFVLGKIYVRCLYMCNIFVFSCCIIIKIGIFEK